MSTTPFDHPLDSRKSSDNNTAETGSLIRSEKFEKNNIDAYVPLKVDEEEDTLCSDPAGEEKKICEEKKIQFFTDVEIRICDNSPCKESIQIDMNNAREDAPSEKSLKSELANSSVPLNVSTDVRKQDHVMLEGDTYIFPCEKTSQKKKKNSSEHYIDETISDREEIMENRVKENFHILSKPGIPLTGQKGNHVLGYPFISREKSPEEYNLLSCRSKCGERSLPCENVTNFKPSSCEDNTLFDHSHEKKKFSDSVLTFNEHLKEATESGKTYNTAATSTTDGTCTNRFICQKDGTQTGSCETVCSVNDKHPFSPLRSEVQRSVERKGDDNIAVGEVKDVSCNMCDGQSTYFHDNSEAVTYHHGEAAAYSDNGSSENGGYNESNNDCVRENNLIDESDFFEGKQGNNISKDRNSIIGGFFEERNMYLGRGNPNEVLQKGDRNNVMENYDDQIEATHVNNTNKKRNEEGEAKNDLTLCREDIWEEKNNRCAHRTDVVSNQGGSRVMHEGPIGVTNPDYENECTNVSRRSGDNEVSLRKGEFTNEGTGKNEYYAGPCNISVVNMMEEGSNHYNPNNKEYCGTVGSGMITQEYEENRDPLSKVVKGGKRKIKCELNGERKMMKRGKTKLKTKVNEEEKNKIKKKKKKIPGRVYKVIVRGKECWRAEWLVQKNHEQDDINVDNINTPSEQRERVDLNSNYMYSQNVDRSNNITNKKENKGYMQKKSKQFSVSVYGYENARLFALFELIKYNSVPDSLKDEANICIYNIKRNMLNPESSSNKSFSGQFLHFLLADEINECSSVLSNKREKNSVNNFHFCNGCNADFLRNRDLQRRTTDMAVENRQDVHYNDLSIRVNGGGNEHTGGCYSGDLYHSEGHQMMAVRKEGVNDLSIPSENNFYSRAHYSNQCTNTHNSNNPSIHNLNNLVYNINSYDFSSRNLENTFISNNNSSINVTSNYNPLYSVFNGEKNEEPTGVLFDTASGNGNKYINGAKKNWCAHKNNIFQEALNNLERKMGGNLGEPNYSLDHGIARGITGGITAAASRGHVNSQCETRSRQEQMHETSLMYRNFQQPNGVNAHNGRVAHEFYDGQEDGSQRSNMDTVAPDFSGKRMNQNIMFIHNQGFTPFNSSNRSVNRINT
ncbi:conserved Plasmodium protein, unknown function [Plasmodium ovale wallikeri]|uniref:Uncharacterized protein n=1 Tax=Plasmodium ovale wallikeri TaxID=864142 RepID=A0A1A8YJS3_PLAOA|nr:conserved Plasmodium protein, unknown function [Plasmodium ovale wallikeri]